jgi:hypothetical protein
MKKILQLQALLVISLLVSGCGEDPQPPQPKCKYVKLPITKDCNSRPFSKIIEVNATHSTFANKDVIELSDCKEYYKLSVHKTNKIHAKLNKIWSE